MCTADYNKLAQPIITKNNNIKARTKAGLMREVFIPVNNSFFGFKCS
jgi:hypothetical protein